MKISLIEEIRNIVNQAKTWAELEVEYAKMTLAEKLTILLCLLIVGFVILLLGMVVLIMLALSLSEVFKCVMSPALSYLATAGVISAILVIFVVLRKQLLLDPISRVISKVFLEKKH
ncbi:MAG: phage holin family protein [Lepagella sp.]